MELTQMGIGGGKAPDSPGNMDPASQPQLGGANPSLNPQGSIIMYLFKKETYADRNVVMWKSVLANPSFKAVVLSFSKPYILIKNEVNRAGVQSQVSYIDVLTSSVGAPPSYPDCTFLASPNALTDISLCISDALADPQLTTVIIDSICSLELYENTMQVMKFVQMIITKIRVAGKKGVFLLSDATSTSSSADIMMFMDAVVKVE